MSRPPDYAFYNGTCFGHTTPWIGLNDLSVGIGKGIYAGCWLEVGNFWQSRNDVSIDDLRYAATLGFGAETVVGPAYLAVGFAENGRRQIYLSIGASF